MLEWMFNVDDCEIHQLSHFLCRITDLVSSDGAFRCHRNDTEMHYYGATGRDMVISTITVTIIIIVIVVAVRHITVATHTFSY